MENPSPDCVETILKAIQSRSGRDFVNLIGHPREIQGEGNIAIVLFNTLPWARSPHIEVPLPKEFSGKSIQLLDERLHPVPFQVSGGKEGVGNVKISFVVPVIPALGYTARYLVPKSPISPNSSENATEVRLEKTPEYFMMTNGRISASVSRKTGHITTVGLALDGDDPPTICTYNLTTFFPPAISRILESLRVEEGPIRCKIAFRSPVMEGLAGSELEYICWRNCPVLEMGIQPSNQEWVDLITLAHDPSLVQNTASGIYTPTKFDSESGEFHGWVDLDGNQYFDGAFNLAVFAPRIRLRLDESGTHSYVRVAQARGKVHSNKISVGLFPHAGSWRANTWRLAAQSTVPLEVYFESPHEGRLPATGTLGILTNPRNVVLQGVEIKKVGGNPELGRQEIVITLREMVGQPIPRARLLFTGLLRGVKIVDAEEFPRVKEHQDPSQAVLFGDHELKVPMTAGAEIMLRVVLEGSHIKPDN